VSKAPRAASAYRDWGSDESQTSIMHVDLDAFYAACELARRPELRGLPVIVGGASRSVVLAATYEARAFGVKSAMSMQSALRVCPQAVVVSPDFRLYSEVSRSVVGMMEEITPEIMQVSVDEAFLDVSGARRRLGAPTAIGASLRAKVRETHGITCSVGIAENEMLAKLASTHAKPDGLLLVPAAATLDFLRTLPVGALPGVGEKTEAQLARWGITQVAELQQLGQVQIQGIVGQAAGAHLYHLARGRDHSVFTGMSVRAKSAREGGESGVGGFALPVGLGAGEPSVRSIGKEVTFDIDEAEVNVVQSRILGLCDQVAARLRATEQVARTLELKVRTSDFKTVTRSRVLDGPTDLAADLYPVASLLFAKVDLHGRPVRLIGVRAQGLAPRSQTGEQTSIERSVSRRDVRDAELALDRVRARFGGNAAHLGI